MHGDDLEHIDKSVVVMGGFNAETMEDQSINRTCMPVGSPFGRRWSSETYLICTRLYKHQEPPQTHNVDHFQCLQKWMRSSVRCSQGAVSCANICHSSICKNRTKAESLVAQLCLGHPAVWSSWDHGGSRSIGPTDDGAHCWLQKRGNDWWGIAPRIGDFWASNARHEIHQISKQWRDPHKQVVGFWKSITDRTCSMQDRELNQEIFDWSPGPYTCQRH